MPATQCHQCKKYYYDPKYDNGIFCSRECFLDSKRDARRRYKARKNLEAKLAREPKPCKVCKRPIPKDLRGSAKYCGDECRERFAKDRSKNYRALQTEEWRREEIAKNAQRQRAKRLAAGHPPCIDCGCEIPTEVRLSIKRCNDCKLALRRQRDREYSRAYAAKNREKVCQKNRRYNAANRDSKNEYFKQWRKDNPDLAKAQRTRRRARQLEAATEDHCYDLEVYIRDGGQCHLCGHPVSWNMPPFHDASFNLEHVVPYVHGGKHHLDNVACSHQQCNFRKGTRLMEDLDLPFDPPVCLTPPSHTTTGMV